MSFLLFNIILFVIILFLLIVLSFVWPPDSPWAPWWRTNTTIAHAACTLADVKKSDIMYELGSGEGNLLLVAAKEFGAKGVGIEIDPLRFFLSVFLIKRNRLSEKVQIIRGNFFHEDFSRATVVFVYLVPKTLERLKPKFLKELSPTTRIVSYRYEMSLPLISFDREHDLRLYGLKK